MLDTLQQLLAQVHALSKDVGEMKEQIREKDSVIESLRAGAKAPPMRSEPGTELPVTKPMGTGPPLPVDHKIAENPKKYSGNVIEFVAWQEKLKIFLEPQDHRWWAILDEIERRSVKPLNEQGFAEVAVATGTLEHMELFQKQLYQYLELFTVGDAHKMVLANRAGKSFEKWRRDRWMGR